MADVPNVAGVPALGSYADQGANDVVISGDSVVGYGSGQTPKWGLYLNGKPAVVAESVVSFGYRDEYSISDYPIENGGFESFDRVTRPFQCQLQFAAGSNSVARRELLSTLAAAKADGNTTKYDVVTPDLIYSSVSITHTDYDRKAASGANLLMIDVWVQEIREQNANSQQTANPGSAPVGTNGTVQPSDVPLPPVDPRTKQPTLTVT